MVITTDTHIHNSGFLFTHVFHVHPVRAATFVLLVNVCMRQ